MVKTTIYMEPEVALTVRQLAAVQGCSQAEVIRAAILAYTDKIASR
jgi:hypothetical protein